MSAVSLKILGCFNYLHRTTIKYFNLKQMYCIIYDYVAAEGNDEIVMSAQMRSIYFRGKSIICDI